MTPRDPAAPSGADGEDAGWGSPDDDGLPSRGGPPTAGDGAPTDDRPTAPPLTPPLPVPAGGTAAGGSAPPATRLGASTFTIEGRSAPGLFVVGWIASLVGLGMALVGVLGGRSGAGVVLILIGLVLLSIGLIAGAGSQGIERRVRGVLPYLGPSPFLVLAASITIAIIALAISSIPLSIAGVPLDGPFAALVSITIQVLLYAGLIRLLVVDTGALTWSEMGVHRIGLGTLGEIGGGAMWALPMIAVTIPLVGILHAFFPVTPAAPLPPTGEAVGFAISLLAGVIVAPFGEELFFRGFATTAWAKAYGPVRGVVQAALLFAFAHVLTISGSAAGEAFQQAILAFGVRVPMALALGWIFLRRRSIWASFGLHASFNAILLIIGEAASRAT